MNNTLTPWEFERNKYEELNTYKNQQQKRISSLKNMQPLLKIVACIAAFFILGLFYEILFIPLFGDVLAAIMGIVFIGVAGTVPVSMWVNKTVDDINNNIKRQTQATEKSIASYRAQFEREQAAENSRKEAEQRQREAEAEALRRQREKEDNERMREWEKSFREKIQREELAADERMSQSALVHEIAQCILPTFKQIVEKVDTEAHMKVRVRLALEVRADTIDYYNAADPQNRSRFVFKEEGIAEKLSPILCKALCKALVTELRLLILEAFPIDPERKMVQADLEGSVVLKSNVTYVPGRDYTAPEYDANSYAYAVILYQASKDKGELHF